MNDKIDDNFRNVCGNYYRICKSIVIPDVVDIIKSWIILTKLHGIIYDASICADKCLKFLNLTTALCCTETESDRVWHYLHWLKSSFRNVFFYLLTISVLDLKSFILFSSFRRFAFPIFMFTGLFTSRSLSQTTYRRFWVGLN